MKKVLAITLALSMALGLATVALASETDKVEGKSSIYLGISGYIFAEAGDGGQEENGDGNYIPGTKFRIEVVEIETDSSGAEYKTNLTKSRYSKSGADVYFKANKGSKYFDKAEMKFESYTDSSSTINNGRAFAQVELKAPYLNMKDNEFEFKLGVKKGSNYACDSFSGDIDNLFFDELGDDNTDVTINTVGSRIKVDDSGFSDIISIDFEHDDEITYEVKMYNKDEVVLYVEPEVDRDISSAFDDVDMEFYFFSQVGSFSAVGLLRLPGNEGDYVYELVTGTPSEVYATFGENEFLVPVDSVWNSDEEALEFRTRNLGRYVVSSSKLDLSEYEDMADDDMDDDLDTSDDEDLSDDDLSSSDTDQDDDDNPATGGKAVAGLAALAGVLALAGVVIFRRK